MDSIKVILKGVSRGRVEGKFPFLWEENRGLRRSEVRAVADFAIAPSKCVKL